MRVRNSLLKDIFKRLYDRIKRAIEIASIIKNFQDIENSTPIILESFCPKYMASKEPNYDKYQPNFAWLPINIIKRTFKATTQYAHIPTSTLLKRHFKSPFPVLNVYH